MTSCFFLNFERSWDPNLIREGRQPHGKSLFFSCGMKNVLNLTNKWKKTFCIRLPKILLWQFAAKFPSFFPISTFSRPFSPGILQSSSSIFLFPIPNGVLPLESPFRVDPRKKARKKHPWRGGAITNLNHLEGQRYALVEREKKYLQVAVQRKVQASTCVFSYL